MPKALPMHLREEIIRRKEEEKVPLTVVAEEMGISYDTVSGIWRRYQDRGKEGLRPDYDRCGRWGVRFDARVHESALEMKQGNPRWGGGLIRSELRRQLGKIRLPHRRSLQRWFRAAGLQPAYCRPLPQNRERAREVHQVWQMDAKEQLQTEDGNWFCLLDVVDEASGAVLSAVLFPPALLEPDCPGGGASRAAADLRGMGPAATTAGR